MINFLLGFQFKRLGRHFKTRPAAKIITTILFLAVFCGVAFGIYRFFISAFLYLKDFPFFRGALTLYSFELFFLLISFLIWMGSVIGLLFGLFKNTSETFIIASPKYQTVPKYVLWSTILSGAWILLFVLFPALWAGAVVFHLGFLSIILELLSAFFLLLLAVLLAYLVIFTIGSIWLKFIKYGFSFKNLSLSLGILAVVVFLFIGRSFSHKDIVLVLSTNDLSLTAAPLAPVLQIFRYFPSTFAAKVVTYVQLNQISKAVGPFWQLLVLTAAVALLCYWLSKNFLNLWQNLANNSGSLAQAQKARKKIVFVPSFLLNSRFGAILYKEKVFLFRTGRNAFWFVFLLFMWVAYIGFNFNLQSRLRGYGDNLTEFPKIILAVQLLILVYFISSLVLRFAFPSFSSERNTAWIFASSPLSMGKLLWAKFSFFALLFGGFSVLAEAINVLFLRLPIAGGTLFLLLSLSAALFITSFGLYFGARFPNFETDDPQTLSTSISGLVFVFGSIVYGAIGAYVYYLYLSGAGFGVPLIFIAASLLATFTLTGSAAAAVGKIDFVPSHQ